MKELVKGGRSPISSPVCEIVVEGPGHLALFDGRDIRPGSSCPGCRVTGTGFTVDMATISGDVALCVEGQGRYCVTAGDVVCYGSVDGRTMAAKVYSKGGVLRMQFADMPVKTDPPARPEPARAAETVPSPRRAAPAATHPRVDPVPSAPVPIGKGKPEKYGEVPFTRQPNPPTRCHEVDWRILGGDLQIVEVELDPGETVVAEAGAMVWMDKDIKFETRLGDGSSPGNGLMSGLFKAAGRMLSGETLFLTHFTNKGNGKQVVGFGAPIPGTIMAVDMSEYSQAMFQKGAFLAAAYGTSLSVGLNSRLGANFFGGEGFVMQKVKGDGMVFVQAGGHVFERRLEGETIRLDTGCLVGYTGGIDYSVELAGGLKTMFFGGEGLALATLSGHGTVWIQSLPFDRLAKSVAAHIPQPSSR